MHVYMNVDLQWGACTLGLTDIWDERNGLLWAEPFEKVDEHLASVYTGCLGAHQEHCVCKHIMQMR